MPPVWCCTFLELLSTTTLPAAITAPASEVVAAHAPDAANQTAPIPPARTGCWPGCLQPRARAFLKRSFGSLSVVNRNNG